MTVDTYNLRYQGCKTDLENRPSYRQNIQYDPYRQPEKLPAEFDYAEVTSAVLDALINQGGCIAWDGDGVGCVVDIIRTYHQRWRQAQAEVDRLQADIGARNLALD
jgi:hypothetical protein